jgi:chromosome condensin MukBEF ATPase and DNA-binding subunit MukB
MSLTLGKLDRRALFLLAAGLAAIVILRFFFSGSPQTQVVSASDSVPLAEKRLERLRQIQATVPGKEAVLKEATAELETREKGLLKVNTAAEAQAELLQLISRVAKANGVDYKGGANEMRDARPFGEDYAEVSVAVTFACQIEQLVNVLAQLGNEPQAVSTNEIRILGKNDKKKIIEVRLSLSGIAPRSVLPKKGAPRAI